MASRFLLPAFLLAAASLPLAAQGEVSDLTEAQLQQRVRELETSLVEARSAGLRSVTVNGKRLSPQHVRREALYLVGARHIEARISECFVEEWRQEAVRGGRDPKEFEISEEEIVAELAGRVKEFQVKYPDVPFWEAVRALTGLDREGYLHQRRQTVIFDRVFFPGAAKDWPEITKEAIMASAADGQGKSFWETMEKTSVDENGEPRQLPELWMMLCRQWVSKQLKKWSDIRYPADGLPGETALIVNGISWRTDEAFEKVKTALFYEDIQKAMLEVVIRECLRQELEKQGAYMSDEEFRKEFDEYRQEFDNSPFNTEVIAMHFKGYPSLEAFRQRWRLMRSYERMIADEITDETLQAHADKYRAFFSDGAVTVDAIQFFARDIKTGAWTPDGFRLAKARAEKAFQAIQDGAKFDDVHTEMGEYYSTDEEKGRLVAKPYNQLRQVLRETEFSDLLMGYSLAHHVFYEAEVGKVVGPLPGTEGYWIFRVNSRRPARNAVVVNDDRTRELVRQDYVAHRFLDWANEVVAKARIE